MTGSAWLLTSSVSSSRTVPAQRSAAQKDRAAGRMALAGYDFARASAYRGSIPRCPARPALRPRRLPTHLRVWRMVRSAAARHAASASGRPR
jgi:hypothetical protein